MNKLIKKFANLTLILCLLIVSFSAIPIEVKGKTLGDLKQELIKKKEEYEDNKQQEYETTEKIEEVEKRISEIQRNIESNQLEIVRLIEEINELNKNIEQKENEIKDTVKFYQISTGTSTYLEYVFGATDFTDLIYRIAITEQLLDYNNKLVEQYNIMIEENNIKKEQLKKEELKLEQEQNTLEVELKKLGNQLYKFTELSMDIEEEIKAQESAIRIYEEQYKCKDDDEISACTTNQLPLDTSFWRPLTTAHRTSEYGYRTYTLNGKIVSDFHTGIDLSTYPNSNVPVYSSASGIVISIIERASCGGNQIYIHHNINGKTYTTGYVHLRKILVSVGDVVTKDTQIGVMGGNPNIETWDRCSTGSHLHFAISTGLYFKDYSSWSSYVSHTINPRTIVNFPSGGTTFYNRTTKY